MQIDKFPYKMIILFILVFGCTSREIVYEPTYALPKQIIPANIDIQSKRKHMHDLRSTLLLYNALIDNIKLYHPKSNLDSLANELETYINTYVDPLLIDYDLSKSNETSAEIARLYLIIASLYYKLHDRKQVRKYIKLFQTRYGENKDYFDLTLNSTNLGYSTLGEGFRELAEKVDYRNRSSTP
jgi:hypothetical protein